jgi:TRAP-type uncharacterized transport system fused permease subunit
LLNGHPIRILLAIISGVVSALALSGVTTGYFRGIISTKERLLLLVSAVCLIFPELISDGVGYGIFLALLVYRVR